MLYFTVYGILVTSFLMIKKKALNERIKESSWCYRKTVCTENSSFVNRSNVLHIFGEIFRVLQLAQPGIMAGWLTGLLTCWLAVWQTKCR